MITVPVTFELGHWDKVRAFAIQEKRQLLVCGEDYLPSANKWSALLLEMRPDDTVTFACMIFNHLRPDTVNVVKEDGKTWYSLWWD